LEEDELAAGILRWAREDAQPSGWQPTDNIGNDSGSDIHASGKVGDSTGHNRPACSLIPASLTAERLKELNRMRRSVAARRSNRTLILH
jgi:hypothetical protein